MIRASKIVLPTAIVPGVFAAANLSAQELQSWRVGGVVAIGAYRLGKKACGFQNIFWSGPNAKVARQIDPAHHTR
jgi:hypothetical protein